MHRYELEALFTQIAAYAAKRRLGDKDRKHRPDVSYADMLERMQLPLSEGGMPVFTRSRG